MLGPTGGPDESMGPQFFLTGGDVTILGGMARILGILQRFGCVKDTLYFSSFAVDHTRN